MKIRYWSKTTPKFFTFREGMILKFQILIWMLSILFNWYLLSIKKGLVLLSFINKLWVRKYFLSFSMHFSIVFMLICISLLDDAEERCIWWLLSVKTPKAGSHSSMNSYKKLIYTINTTGPRQLPCGTPNFNEKEFDKCWFIFIFVVFLKDRKLSNPRRFH